ncbi:2-C-methyl-D-erythritol 4-phosphate cytidylyltransferase [uncultured Oxalicibacterium sp.]|uniref:2-C-methyl-D-erythritol 4-phosphate cytidylyltransferase n=1 Tax=uncultured Oxalicibacterium sp. TaxID=1168540 RepID=UPI00260084AD|nr:2-C-methyl-D-erythritol 4-phosphate cytidylyltransferase [uncultured Oxalicibacterium sp.]
MSSARYFGLVPAAGIGARMGAAIPKQYANIAGKPMLMHVLDTFVMTPAIVHTFVVVSPEDGYIDSTLAASSLHGRGELSVLRVGGATRQDSVLHGLRTMRDRVHDDDWILVHDAARPGLDALLIARLIDAVSDDAVGGLLALPVVDTIKRADDAQRAAQTVPREQLWAAQTPQMFRYGLLRKALEQAVNVTDEASAIEALGLTPKLVEGSTRNFKVTLPQDVALAELYLKGLA